MTFLMQQPAQKIVAHRQPVSLYHVLTEQGIEGTTEYMYQLCCHVQALIN